MIGLLLVLFAVVSGAFLPLQAGVNRRLPHVAGGPVRASMISFFVAAQLAMSVLADQFGWVGFERHATTPLRRSASRC